MLYQNVSITYVYRNGSQFTEYFPKEQNVTQLTNKLIEARRKVLQESNIVDAKLNYKGINNPNVSLFN